MNAIQMNKVTKLFGTKKVLSMIDLHVVEGEIFGLLGPSGAGKTTIIKLLIGQIGFDGEACVMDMDCHCMHNEIYEKIGISLDNNGFYERLSIYDNLLLFAKLAGVAKAEIAWALEAVDLSKDAKSTVSKISKGMRQRLALAKAILHKPRILFLEEPTSGLDPLTMRQIHQLIQELNQQGTTIFLTTHNMEEANKLCHHIALLHDGKICEYGDPSELCQKYNYLNKLTVKLKDGRNIQYANNAENAQKIYEVMLGEQLLSIHSSEPTLESVFLEITGKEMDI